MDRSTDRARVGMPAAPAWPSTRSSGPAARRLVLLGSRIGAAGGRNETEPARSHGGSGSVVLAPLHHSPCGRCRHAHACSRYE